MDAENVMLTFVTEKYRVHLPRITKIKQGSCYCSMLPLRKNISTSILFADVFGLKNIKITELWILVCFLF